MATSIEEIQEILAGLGRSMVESDKRREDMERVLAESRAETERIMKELAETQKATEQSIDRMSRKVDKMTDKFGGLNNSVGQLVQMVVIPGVKEKMNILGYNFTMATVEKDYYKADGKSLTEADLLLENCKDVMVIEVKTTLTLEDVNHHLRRLEILRKNENITGMSGKVMYAAIACIRFKEGAREYAVENGMYLIDIEEDTDRIGVVSPETVGKW
ncbi:MAG: hypothetical protein FWC23_05950 [Chitinispirillia bacterium]|nr:hypothetical protein [Chitinispirillia bacterium]MCL2268710.1 hypothetical protein [Chitinispirillia bacterium]